MVRGPNIKPLPEFKPLAEILEGEVLLKLGDNITTDHILPGGAKILPLRSNVPEISKYTFSIIDANFYERARKKNGGFIIGGHNYGQGSSREHAAIAPKYLGIKAVIAKSFARIHHANLINFGVLPLIFKEKEDYNEIEQGDKIKIILDGLEENILMKNITKNKEIILTHALSKREISIIKAGGKLAYIKNKR